MTITTEFSTNRWKIPALMPGESYKGVQGLPIPSRSVFKIVFKADANNQVAESNEGNNEETYTIYTGYKFDPAALALVFNPSKPKMNEQLVVSAQLSNVGNLGGIVDSINWKIVSPAGKVALDVTTGGPIYLNAGDSPVIPYYFVPSESGTYTITVTVKGAYDENAANNMVTKTVFVETDAPAPFSTLDYDILIKPGYVSSPSLIRLFEPTDRWRFQAEQTGTMIKVAGLEDSINYDMDYNDLGFGVAYLDNDRIVVAITACETAAADAITFKWTGKLNGNSAKKLTIEETDESVEGNQPEIELFPKCQGNINQYRTIKVSDIPVATAIAG
jgi:hypothetical protein